MSTATRRRLLDAAATVFGERGYSDTSVKQVAEQAGLTTGALYANFPSKAALFLAVAADQHRLALTADPPALPRPASAREALEQFARRYAGRVAEGNAETYAQGLELMTLTLRDIDGLAALLQLRHAAIFVLRRYLERVASPDEAAVEFQHVATNAAALVAGAAQMRVVGAEFVDLDGLAAGAGQLVAAARPRRLPGALPPVDAHPLVQAHEAALPPEVVLYDALARRTVTLRSGSATLLATLRVSSLHLIGAVHAAAREQVPDASALRIMIVVVDDTGIDGMLGVAAAGLVDTVVSLPAAAEVLDLAIVLDHDGAVPDAFDLPRDRDGLILLDGAGLIRARESAADPVALAASFAAASAAGGAA